MFEAISFIIKGIINALSHPVQSFGWYKNIYRPQVKAKKNPYTTCFSHCTSWFLQNVSKYYTDENMNPDVVTTEINAYKYQEWTKNNLGAWTFKRFAGNLNQLWDVQRKYIEDKLFESGEKDIGKVVFDYNTTVAKIKDRLGKSPVIVNTNPTYNGKKLGHVMLIVAYGREHNEWVVDDPFGDFRIEYKKGHTDGNDLNILIKDFEKIRGSMSIYLV